MVKKKTEKQSNHDQNVKAIADELKKDKWTVKANLEGYEKPAQMKDYLPDIEAEKGGLKRICEVVTEEMFKGDKQKYIELKNYCDEYDFHFYIIDKDGKRRQIDPETFGKK
jgi:hypothetical protein